jgi:hypothetical protein
MHTCIHTHTHTLHAERPELVSGSVEYVAPADYMVRPPQPPAFVFVIDVSARSVQSGMLSEICSTILSVLPNLPGQPRTQVCLSCMYVCVHVSLHTCMPLCLTAYTLKWVYIYMYVYVHIFTLYTHIHAYVHTHILTCWLPAGRFLNLRLVIPLLQPQEQPQRAADARSARSRRPFPPAAVGVAGQFERVATLGAAASHKVAVDIFQDSQSGFGAWTCFARERPGWNHGCVHVYLYVYL